MVRFIFQITIMSPDTSNSFFIIFKLPKYYIGPIHEQITSWVF